MLVAQPIYAGETPLACTLAVQQTGPLTLTVSAGLFRTTGEARVASFTPSDVDDIANGLAEWVEVNKTVRHWRRDAQGQVLERSRTLTFAAPSVFTLTASDVPKVYLIEIGTVLGVPELLCRSRLHGGTPPAPPNGWQPVRELVGPFVVQPSTTDLALVTIPVFTVLAGFPDGITPEAWRASPFKLDGLPWPS